jgi:mannose-6-phosphate isomerase-like protein (cupin superfamily)
VKVRRVVTGQNADGKSVVVSDEQLEPITVSLAPGAEYHVVWGSDTSVSLPTDGRPPTASAWFPPASGFRFIFVTFPPHTSSDTIPPRTPAAVAEFQDKLPGLDEVMEPDNPGMHTSDTIDFVLILSGEIWLELDDGAEVRVGAGECVVQNGARHAWRNKSAEPCVAAATLVGAPRQHARQ